MTSSREAPSPEGPLLVSVPCPGDFVVMKLNPVLSVMHLDSLAKEEAAAMRPRPYLALTLQSYGLVATTNATNKYELLLVRDTGRPPPDHIDEKFRIPPDIASRLAIPISNIPLRQNDNEDQVLVMPDFPRPGCVIEFIYGSRCVRVTTTARDFTKALTMSIPESSHLRHLNRCAEAALESLVDVGDIPTGFNPRGDADVMRRQFVPPECMDDGKPSSGSMTPCTRINICQTLITCS
ncbi:hypothetical protein PENSPDRAFT_471723 [Peniophora sp. CONT]|nr:hypothetical protein PENSPDRAFT_471723 [Peniophora sp. CONT]